MAVNPVLHFLRRIRASDAMRKTPDAELLARFIASHDEAAFAALVQRHGTMVLRVCIRILGDSPDAEDSFQATFLVLARRACSLSRPALLGNWLYGVAYRTALKVRADAARRRTSGREDQAVDAANPADEAARHELRRVLDDELSRLPDRYRVPLVLHYLEGRSQEEVAQLVGCPRKTITTRLARACERLRGRLTRRGLAMTTGSLTVALAEEASAAVPATLFDVTVNAAMLFVAGGSALASSTVAAIAEGVIQAMFITKVKVGLACIVLLGAVATAAGVLGHQGQTAGTPAQFKVATPNDNPNAAPPDKSDQPLRPGKGGRPLPVLTVVPPARVNKLLDQLRPGDHMSQLLKEQYEVARADVDALSKMVQDGWQYEYTARVPETLSAYLNACRRLLQAEFDLGRRPEDHTAALEEYVKQLRESESTAKTRYKQGITNMQPVYLAAFTRIRAEIWLEKFKTTGKLPTDAPALPR